MRRGDDHRVGIDCGQVPGSQPVGVDRAAHDSKAALADARRRSGWLGRFLIGNHISVTALADAVMFVGFAMMIANRAVLLVRSRRVAARPGAPGQGTLTVAPAAETA